MTAVAAKFRGYDDEAKRLIPAGVGGGKRATVATGKRHRRIDFLRLSAEPTASPSRIQDERERTADNTASLTRADANLAEA